MPTNRTKNYDLSQWEPEDQVLRTDFNEDNEKIDAAIKAVDEKADGKAERSALNALSQTVDGKADISALEKLTATVNSLSGTVSGQGSALTGKGNCQIVTTSYVGKGASGSNHACSLTFDAQPTLVAIIDQSGIPLIMMRPFTGASRTNYGAVAVSWGTRGVSWYSGTSEVTQLNSSGLTYYVVALLTLS